LDREEIVKRNYKDHIATIDQYAQLDCGRVDIEVLTWKRPDSSSYMIKYIITGNILCVYGDLGQAIYRWGQKLTFEWLSGLNLSYFKGKCEASEVGRDFREWDEYKAKEQLQFFAEDGSFKMSELEERGGDGSLFSERDWEEWLNENGYDVLGADFWAWAYNIGYTVNTRCLYHFIGLQMAMKQIKEKENVKTV